MNYSKRKVFVFETIRNMEESKKTTELLRENGFFVSDFPIDDTIYPEIVYNGIRVYYGLDGARKLIKEVKREEEYLSKKK